MRHRGLGCDMGVGVFYKSDMRIKVLNSDVVNQIAAGEVLERPANLVKELLENALDAGATEVEIHIADGGKWVEISDNGSGIHKEDLALCFARHATSKINNSADLWQLNTYGFRGEALASISAVSKCSILSKTKTAKSAWQIECAFGETSTVQESSCEQGTRVRVEELFENVPARLKFLKSDKAEVAQIKKVIRAMALCYSHINFRFKVENKLLKFWSKCESTQKRCEQVLEVKPMYNGEHSIGSFHSKAVFSAPNAVQRNSQNIWIFVQDRWVQDKSLQTAILQAYQNLLMHGEFPIVAVWLDCDPQMVDVNVHPTKSQVKFSDAQMAFRCVRNSIRDYLEKAPWLEDLQKIEDQKPKETLNIQSIAKEKSEKSLAFKGGAFDSVRFLQKSYEPKEMNIDVLKHYAPKMDEPIPEQTIDFKVSEEIVNTVDEPVEDLSIKHHWSKLQVLGQLNLTYIVCQSRKSLLLVDQHAAHERVVFEKLMAAWQGGNIEVQDFLLPLSIEVPGEYIDALLEVKDKLSRFGIGFEKSGTDEISVISSPAILKENGLKVALYDLGKELCEFSGSNVIERRIADIFSTMACHSVIRAGQALSVEEMESLLVQMDEFPLSSFCPHGRPVFVEYTYNQIDKSFGRIL